jgi:hypothetical protein
VLQLATGCSKSLWESVIGRFKATKYEFVAILFRYQQVASVDVRHGTSARCIEGCSRLLCCSANHMGKRHGGYNEDVRDAKFPKLD